MLFLSTEINEYQNTNILHPIKIHVFSRDQCLNLHILQDLQMLLVPQKFYCFHHPFPSKQENVYSGPCKYLTRQCAFVNSICEKISIYFCLNRLGNERNLPLGGIFSIQKGDSDKMGEKLYSDVFLKVSGESLPGECDTAGLTAPS